MLAAVIVLLVQAVAAAQVPFGRWQDDVTATTGKGARGHEVLTRTVYEKQ